MLSVCREVQMNVSILEDLEALPQTRSPFNFNALLFQNTQWISDCSLASWNLFTLSAFRFLILHQMPFLMQESQFIHIWDVQDTVESINFSCEVL